MDDLNRTYEITLKAFNKMYDVVDHDSFPERDAILIYSALEKEMQPVDFGFYLKRYIYEKSGMKGSMSEIPLKEYQMIIQTSFQETRTPASFTPGTAKLSALSKNWLTQRSVKRQVVLLLGFGLKMSEADVNDFLYKALHEEELNVHDPTELICQYCYAHGYGFYKFKQLWDVYGQMSPDNLDMKLIYQNQPAGREESIKTTQEDAKLMTQLLSMKTQSGISQSAEKAYQTFDMLYDKARELIADLYNRESLDENQLYVHQLRDRLDRNDRLYDEQKLDRLRKAESEAKVWTKDDITESDLEHILYSAIPLDRHGNLTPVKNSTLNSQFEGKRLSRKRLNELIHRRANVERFDLITLHFFIHAQQVDTIPNAQRRYTNYIDATNRLLKECRMGPIYVTNPYECFILMCILSLSPLETFADVMEMSYQAESDIQE